jgi:hypothetical protein
MTMGFVYIASGLRSLAMINLSDEMVRTIIEVITKYVVKEDPHADKATHPIEMNIIDFLVEKRSACAREISAAERGE